MKVFWLIATCAFAADISPQAFLADVKYLASPELKGRATGSPDDKGATGTPPVTGTKSTPMSFPARAC